MKLRLIQVPYDTGRRDTRMGRGPGRILDAGAAARLEARGHQVKLATVDPQPMFPAEVATAFAVMAGVAGEVGQALADGDFPIVLAGNCNTTVGTVGGLALKRVGVVWMDGHADFETPETTSTGFIDGMGLAILTGRCWRTMTTNIPGFTPVMDRNVILAGASDIEPSEHESLRQSEIVYLSDEVLARAESPSKLKAALTALAKRVDGIHLHVDLDVHDPRLAPANHFRPPGGLTPERLREVVGEIVETVPVLSAAITAYDPDVDLQRITLKSCLSLLEIIAGGRRIATSGG